jgi:hypothetical protein
MLLAGFSAAAQDAPPATPPNKWDISKYDVSKLPPASDKTGLTYDNDIKPLLQASCFNCHGEQRPRKNLRLDSLEAVLKGGDDGKVVVPGDSTKSLLAAAAGRIDPAIAMPPRGGGRRNGGGGPPPNAGATPPPPPPDAGATPPATPPNGAPGRGRGPAPLTPEQAGLIRAWIDQGAK